MYRTKSDLLGALLVSAGAMAIVLVVAAVVMSR
jgi:hypothetical protein